VRTPLTKANKGGLKDTPLDGMLVKLLKQVIAKSNLDPALVEDICLGNVRLQRCRLHVKLADIAPGLGRQSRILHPCRHARRWLP
jgi:acetyl-CoA acyltransferase 1